MHPENGSSWSEGVLVDQWFAMVPLPASSQSSGLFMQSNDLKHTINASSPMVLSRRDGQIIGANQAFSNLVSRPAESLPGIVLWDLTHPDDVAPSRDLFARLVQREIPEYYIEKRYRRPDGSDIWSSVHAVLADPDPENPRVLGIIQDESAFVGSGVMQCRLVERMFTTTFERSSFGMILLDPNACIVQVNDAIAASLGFSHRELTGRKLAAITHPDGLAVQEQNLRAVLTSDANAAHFVTRFMRKDAALMWVEVCLSAVRDASGRLVYCTAQIQDVTDRHNLEHQLQQSQKLESLGLLAGGIAHDFNNLLMVISAYSEMVSESISDGRLKAQVGEVIAASQKAATLTRQLLAFSRRQTVELQPVDLNRAMRDSERLLGRVLGANITISLELASDLATAFADPGQIDQVIINLALNARDAMPNGGTITIKTENTVIDELYARFVSNLQPGEYILLTFSDTGTGIPFEIVDKVFEPFFTTKERGQGTGLGLSTVYGIVRQSRGHISVRSESGKGATFSILLPRFNGTHATAAETPDGREVRANRNGLVLLVEDEAAVRFSVKEFVSRMGYTVIDAATAEEAFLLACSHDHIDLLITDLMLPKIGGEKLARALRIRQKDLKVLLMSGYADLPGASHDSRDPEFHFISKPFTYAKLVARINSILP